MKKVFGVLILAVLLLFCSCSSASDGCWYGFFGNEAYAFIYSSSKNTIYEVKLPLQSVISWGEQNNIGAVDQAVVKFCGIGADGILASSALNRNAFCDILNSMDKTGERTPYSRLQAMVDNSVRLSQDPLASAMSRLLGSDIKPALRLIAENSPSACFLDATGYESEEDTVKVQKYVSTWLKQVINGERI